ncbi:MAG: glycosyltransferase family 2 protein [Gemmatimonadales bacterium]
MVTHDGGDRLLHALEALEQQTLPPHAVIVVDSASRDDTAARVRARFPRVTLLRLDANAGPSVARNAGLRSAATELVLLVDHDIYLARECLERLVGARDEWNAVVACPRIRLHPEREIVQADGGEPHFVGALALRNGFRTLGELPPAHVGPVGAVPSGCLLVHRGRVLEAGGFDELIFFYFEDLEFSLRLRSLGHCFVAVPSAEAFHDRGAGSPGLAFRGGGHYPPERFHLTLRHRLLALLVHYRVRTLVVLGPALLLYELASVALALRRGLLGAWARAWMWQFRNAPAIRARRRTVQRARTRPDRDILVGGPLPLAPGVIGSRAEGSAVRLFSSLLDAYWRLVRRSIG